MMEFMLISSLISMSRIVIEVEVYRHALQCGAARTAAVVLQELAYRVIDDSQSRATFLQLEKSVPARLRQPVYSYGFLWPDKLRHAHRSPEETRRERFEAEMGYKAALRGIGDFNLYVTSEQCLGVLSGINGIRSGTLTIPDSHSTASQVELTRSVLELATEWRDKRLVSALLCDLLETSDLQSLRECVPVLEGWKPMQRLVRDTLPPGCDTHLISWESFCFVRDNPHTGGQSDFGDLLDRIRARCAAPESATPREAAIARLERVLDVEFTAEGLSARVALDAICLLSGIRDATEWTSLREVDKAKQSLNIHVWKWERAPIRLAVQRLVFEAFGGNVDWQIIENGAIQLQSHRE